MHKWMLNEVAALILAVCSTARKSVKASHTGQELDNQNFNYLGIELDNNDMRF